MTLYRLVALARALLQGFYIKNLDFASAVFDQIGSLEGVCDELAGSLHAQHLRQIFLRKIKRVAARQVSRPLAPPHIAKSDRVGFHMRAIRP